MKTAATGRPRTKANPRLFRLRKELDTFLRLEAKRNKIEMTKQLENWIEEKRQQREAEAMQRKIAAYNRKDAK